MLILKIFTKNVGILAAVTNSCVLNAKDYSNIAIDTLGYFDIAPHSTC